MSEHVPLICMKCGHGPAFHGESWCIYYAGGAIKRECDCDGWMRDQFDELYVDDDDAPETYLWILEPVAGSGPWDPWYDKAFGFVIRAATESDARRIAHESAGDENRGGADPWLDPSLSTCEILIEDGEPGIIMRDFASA